MNPHPDVAKYERQGHKEQPHVRVARASVNPSLPPLTITCLDAKAFSVSLADVGGSAVDPPGGEEKLLTLFLVGSAVPVATVADANRETSPSRFPLFMVCEYQPAGCRLRARRPVSLQPFLGRRPANFTGIKNGRFSCCKNSHHRDVEKRPVQQEILDFQANFANPGQQPPQDRDHRLVASNPGQGQGVTSSVLARCRRWRRYEIGRSPASADCGRFRCGCGKGGRNREPSASRSPPATLGGACSAASLRSGHRSTAAPEPATSWEGPLPRPSARRDRTVPWPDRDRRRKRRWTGPRHAARSPTRSLRCSANRDP